MMSFKVIKAGFLTTVQDYGRLRHGAHGISQSGVMDEHAYAWGNYLLENNFNAAALEITFGGVELEVLDDAVICVCGGDLDFKINQISSPNWHSIAVKKSDKLSWAMPKNGIRAYLMVKDGLQTSTMFDSKSVNLRENIGVKIVENDILNCKTSTVILNHFIAPKYLPDYSSEIVLNVLPSYQYQDFTESQKSVFFGQTYTISNANDRTGCRLNGEPIKLDKNKMISEAMSYGSVEIAADGLPIILLKDAPTIGGYAKIGTVFSLDLAKLSQQQPTAKVRFKLMDIEQAQTQRLKFNQFFGILNAQNH
jgi:biotin-dependent carboxylase-like uncharacterized protein